MKKKKKEERKGEGKNLLTNPAGLEQILKKKRRDERHGEKEGKIKRL